MKRTDDIADFFAEIAARHRRCVWLDGGGARGWAGQRSLIGWLAPDDVSLTYSRATGLVTRHTETESVDLDSDIFDALRSELRDGGQWFGYFGYAARSDLPGRGSQHLPDAVWMCPSHIELYEHPQRTDQSAAGQPDVATAGAPDSYREAFAEVQEHLFAGNSYEVNLTYRDQAVSERPPADVYLDLRRTNPAPYAGYLQHDLSGAGAYLLSSSPERYALIEDRNLETKPIKGTTPRGVTAEADEAARHALATGPKFSSENLMIVDLLRNDLAMVCEPGTVEVPELMQVESYASVHQLVSTVRGRLRDGVSTLDALQSLFPAGSMTGAPKYRTMQIIDEVESSPRGAYAGAFGWISADGGADLGVIIRSLTTTGDGTYRWGTGGAITVHSDVAEEYAETRWKSAKLRAALRSPQD